MDRIRYKKFKNLTFIGVFLMLTATNVFAEEVVERVIKSISFDAETATVSYELTHPAKIRIRIGTKEGPLMRTIVDWQERDIGLYKEDWDGFDLTKKVKLIGTNDLVFTFNYFTKDDAFLRNVTTEDILPHPEQLVEG